MLPPGTVKFSLKSKMLLFIGGIINLMMFVISVLDVLVYAENGNFLSDDLLQTYLVDFQNKIPGVKYCMIFNWENRVIVHSYSD